MNDSYMRILSYIMGLFSGLKMSFFFLGVVKYVIGYDENFAIIRIFIMFRLFLRVCD